MVLASMILVCSAALCLFYFQATCQNILRQEFDPERLRSIASAYRLEFLLVRNEVGQAQGHADYRWMQTALKCDYLALTYLLKHSAPSGCTGRERLLMIYFKALSLVLSVSHLLKLDEKRTVLQQTAILNYFANILGEQTSQVQFGTLGA